MTIEEKKKCFVIMPFSKSGPRHTKKYWDNHFNNFLKPLIESAPLEAYRVHPLRSDIVEQIVKDLITAPIVVADLTHANPNVYWELGVRQSFKHGTITIAEQNTPRPFDIARKATLYYVSRRSTGYTGNAKFIRDFSDALKDCLNNPESPDSLVLQTIAGRSSLYQIVKGNETIRRLVALQQENKFNYTLLDTVRTTCSQNTGLRARKKPTECKVITGRPRLICLENLLVNRYIDAEDSFYEHAHQYFLYAVAFSEQLSEWSRDPANTEQWLSMHSTKLMPYIDQFSTLIETARTRILSTL